MAVANLEGGVGQICRRGLGCTRVRILEEVDLRSAVPVHRPKDGRGVALWDGRLGIGKEANRGKAWSRFFDIGRALVAVFLTYESLSVVRMVF
jgi:hypothetical protein